MFTAKSLICISLILVFAMALNDGDEVAFKTHGSHNNPQYQYLNAGTVDGSVRMAVNTDYNSLSGTWWRAHKLSDGNWGFESLGSIPNDQHIYLNADTYSGQVNLAANTDYATVSGTHWSLVSLSDGTVALQNMGSHSNPTYKYLNTNTYTGQVNLAGSTDYNSVSGTHWEIVMLAPAGGNAIVVTGAVGAVTGAVTGAVNGAVNGAVGAVNGAVGAVNGAVGTVTGVVGDVGGAVKSGFCGFFGC